MCVLSCPCLCFSLFFLSLCVSLRAAAVVLRTMDGRKCDTVSGDGGDDNGDGDDDDDDDDGDD